MATKQPKSTDTVHAKSTDAVHAHINQFVEILNKKHVKDMATEFDGENALFIGASGTTIGHKAIAKRFANMFQGRFKDAGISMQVQHVNMLGPTIAVVGATCVATSIRRTSGDPVKPLKSNTVTVLVNKSNRWVIVAQAIVNETAPHALVH